MGKEKSTMAPFQISRSGCGLDYVHGIFRFGSGSCCHLCGVFQFLPRGSMGLAG